MLLLLLLLSTPLFAQWGTPPPVVTNQQCQDELKEMIECRNKEEHYNINDDIPSTNKTYDRIIIQEMSHILECTSQLTLNCNTSRIYESYLLNKKWIAETFLNRLESCLSFYDWRKTYSTCLKSEPTDDDECNPVELTTLCQIEQFRTRPQCTKADLRLIKKVNAAIRAECMMGKQMEVEVDHYGIPKDIFKSDFKKPLY